MEENYIETNKNKFIQLLKTNVKREGIDSLIDWLSKTDFFVAPASTKFHSAFEGGLCEHCLKVFDRFVKLLEGEYKQEWQQKCSLESATIIALLHDVCKADFYAIEMRNVKENGNWVQKPYYTVADKLPYGHGEKSVYIVNSFIRLTREEAMAINWHMGEYDLRVKAGANISDVYYKYPLAFVFHIADNMATYLDEEKV